MCASVIWAMSCKCLQKKSFEENAYGVYMHAKKMPWWMVRMHCVVSCRNVQNGTRLVAECDFSFAALKCSQTLYLHEFKFYKGVLTLPIAIVSFM